MKTYIITVNNRGTTQKVQVEANGERPAKEAALQIVEAQNKAQGYHSSHKPTIAHVG